VNDCPSQEAALTVAPITGATSYSWSIIYGVDDADEVITTEPAYTADFTTFAKGQSLTYTVSGVNSVGKGVASPPHVVTKQLCIAAKPVILGNDAWKTMRGDTAVYTTACPATAMSGTATVASGNVIRYNWYWQLVGTDSELTSWSTDGSAVQNLGGLGYTYNFAVVAETVDGVSPMSDIIQVIVTACGQPNPPGGINGKLALYPSDAYPQVAPYSFGINNCELQEKTGLPATTVKLTCNSAQPTEQDKPVTGYAYWVKTAENESYKMVYASTSTGSAARTIAVDGSKAFPSGTYVVTAVNKAGHSAFGNNWIAVNIRTDCPPLVVELDAPTLMQGLGGTFANGTFTNACPSRIADLSLTIPSKYASVVSDIIWTRVKSGGGTEVAWQGTNRRDILDLSVTDNGTYSVSYKIAIGSDTYESPAVGFVMDLKICPPTFLIKPSVIVEPAKYATVQLSRAGSGGEPSSTATPVTQGYEWYYNGASASTAEVVDVTSSATAMPTFQLYKEGQYKVKIKTSKGNSDFSETITLAKVTPPTAYTRADLIGSYKVADWKGNGGAIDNNYTLTIAAGTGANDIVITGLGGNRGSSGNPWYAKLNATVTFTTDGKTTGNYGAITIPKQKFLGTATGTTDCMFRHGTGYTSPTIKCDDDNVTFTIKFIDGKPGVSQSGTAGRYGIWQGTTECQTNANLWGGSNQDASTWTKQ
jgi:hypothetical protein